MSYEVSMVPAAKLYEVEDEVFAWLQPAIDMTNGRFSRDSYAKDIESGRSQLWIAFHKDSLSIDGAIITNIETYPHKTMLCWALMGGSEFSDWHSPMYALIEDFRQKSGCDGSEMVGRRGWCRFMKQYGWKEQFAFLDFFPDAEDVQNVA
jgi:hypothetical protein